MNRIVGDTDVVFEGRNAGIEKLRGRDPTTKQGHHILQRVHGTIQRSSTVFQRGDPAPSVNGEILHQPVIGKLIILRHVLITPFRR